MDDGDDMLDPLKRKALMRRAMREGLAGGEEISEEALDEWSAMMEWMLGVQNAIDDAPERIRNYYFRKLNRIGVQLAEDLGVDAIDSERRGRLIMTLLAYGDDDDGEEDADAPSSPSNETVPA